MGKKIWNSVLQSPHVVCGPEGGIRHGTYSPRDASEGKVPQRRRQKPLDRWVEEVAKAVGGGYCQLQMPFSLALAVGGGSGWA